MIYSKVPRNLTMDFEVKTEGEFHFSTTVLRGLIFNLDSAVDPGTVMEMHLGVPSMSGKINFLVKVIDCKKLDDGSFDVYTNYTEKEYNTIEEIEEMIRSIS